ncbi:DUF6059 family protein [Streptomyces sp. NPDC058618]
MSRCLKVLGEWIVAAGGMWPPVPSPPTGSRPVGPPPGHPERLGPGDPLTVFLNSWSARSCRAGRDAAPAPHGRRGRSST